MPSVRNLRLKMEEALASLHSEQDNQSEVTNQSGAANLSDITTMSAAELNEVLVDLDALFTKFDVGDPLKNAKWSKVRAFNQVGIYVGTEAIVEGEPAKPGHVHVSSDGYLTFRFHSPNPDGFGYASFDVINTQLGVMFPEAWKGLYEMLAADYGASLADVAGRVREVLQGKPQLIELANKAVSNGRMMRASALLEAEQELKDVGYEADDDYGQF